MTSGWSLRLFRGYVLHGMCDVPGVTLSGSVHMGFSHRSPVLAGRLAVDGRLDGALTLRGRTLSGRIGGATVRARLTAW